MNRESAKFNMQLQSPLQVISGNCKHIQPLQCGTQKKSPL